jgi:hypothetical protein
MANLVQIHLYPEGEPMPREATIQPESERERHDALPTRKVILLTEEPK